MTDSVWASEVARYLTLAEHERQRWLARLLYSLTIFARGTYTVGEDGLDDPKGMRRFNEFLHRTASQLCDHMGNSPKRPDEVFLQMAGQEISALRIDVEGLVNILRR